MLVGFFKVSHVHLALCQSLSSLSEYFQLFAVAVTDLFIFLHNFCQSLGNVEKLFSAQGTVSFESSTYGSVGKQQLTELVGGCHDL